MLFIPYLILVIALILFVIGVLTIPLWIYYGRRASQISAARIDKALHEPTPAPDIPPTYEQRKIDRAKRIAEELDIFDERLKGDGR